MSCRAYFEVFEVSRTIVGSRVAEGASAKEGGEHEASKVVGVHVPHEDVLRRVTHLWLVVRGHRGHAQLHPAVSLAHVIQVCL